MTTEYGISLGSNAGDRLALLRAAAAALEALPGSRLAARSAVYETEPVDVDPRYRDRAFLNAVAILESTLAPDALHARLQAIETAMGRQRGPDRNAPRTLDLDILYAGDRHEASASLHLPHPRWAERRFVVQPLADVRPDLVLPGAKGPVAAVLSALPPRPAVVPYSRDWTSILPTTP
jgi:2-amino-4-hydroxy-6-hydroxymethyldihydropteridine diphosphokinase